MALRTVCSSQPRLRAMAGDVLAAGTGQHDLAAAEGKGIRGAQAGLQRLALGVRQRTHEERGLHGPQHTAFQKTLPEEALGVSPHVSCRSAAPRKHENHWALSDARRLFSYHPNPTQRVPDPIAMREGLLAPFSPRTGRRAGDEGKRPYDEPMIFPGSFM